MDVHEIEPRLAELILTLCELGFQQISLKDILNRQNYSNGWEIIVDQPILTASIRDCSFLHFTPKVVTSPITLIQLKIIITNAQKYQIPISFASGKTGLSGGFATPFLLVDLAQLITLEQPIRTLLNLQNGKNQ